MEFELSKHAENRMRERQIELNWIEMTLVEPERDEQDPIDPDARHAMRRIAEKDNRVLRVVYNIARLNHDESSRFTLIGE